MPLLASSLMRAMTSPMVMASSGRRSTVKLDPSPGRLRSRRRVLDRPARERVGAAGLDTHARPSLSMSVRVEDLSDRMPSISAVRLPPATSSMVID